MPSPSLTTATGCSSCCRGGVNSARLTVASGSLKLMAATMVSLAKYTCLFRTMGGTMVGGVRSRVTTRVDDAPMGGDTALDGPDAGTLTRTVPRAVVPASTYTDTT